MDAPTSSQNAIKRSEGKDKSQQSCLREHSSHEGVDPTILTLTGCSTEQQPEQHLPTHSEFPAEQPRTAYCQISENSNTQFKCTEYLQGHIEVFTNTTNEGKPLQYGRLQEDRNSKDVATALLEPLNLKSVCKYITKLQRISNASNVPFEEFLKPEFRTDLSKRRELLENPTNLQILRCIREGEMQRPKGHTLTHYVMQRGGPNDWTRRKVEKIIRITQRFKIQEKKLLEKFMALNQEYFSSFFNGLKEVEGYKWLCKLRAEASQDQFKKRQFQYQIIFLLPKIFFSHVERMLSLNKNTKSNLSDLSETQLTTVKHLLLMTVGLSAREKTFESVQSWHQKPNLAEIIASFRKEKCEEILGLKYPEYGELRRRKQQISEYEKAEKRLENNRKFKLETQHLEGYLEKNSSHRNENDKDNEKMLLLQLSKSQNYFSLVCRCRYGNEGKANKDIRIAIKNQIEKINTEFSTHGARKQLRRQLQLCRIIEGQQAQFNRYKDSPVGRYWYSSRTYFKEMKALLHPIMQGMSAKQPETFISIANYANGLIKLEQIQHFSQNFSSTEQNQLIDGIEANLQVPQLKMDQYRQGICGRLCKTYIFWQTEGIDTRCKHSISSFEYLHSFHRILTALKNEKEYKRWEQVLQTNYSSKIIQQLKRFHNISNNFNTVPMKQPQQMEDVHNLLGEHSQSDFQCRNYLKSFYRHLTFEQATKHYRLVLKLLTSNKNKPDDRQELERLGNISFPCRIDQTTGLLSFMRVGEWYYVTMEYYNSYTRLDRHVLAVHKIESNTFNFYNSNDGRYTAISASEVADLVKEQSLGENDCEIISVERFQSAPEERQHFFETISKFSISLQRLSRFVCFDQVLRLSGEATLELNSNQVISIEIQAMEHQQEVRKSKPESHATGEIWTVSKGKR